MPGKVDPTQCVAIVMISIQVTGNDAAVALESQGNFELDAMRPVIINDALHSIHIPADGSEKLRQFSVERTELNRDRIKGYLDGSAMQVTAVSPVIGYQNTVHIAEKAIADSTTRERPRSHPARSMRCCSTRP
jgi:fumarate hydratase class II